MITSPINRLLESLPPSWPYSCAQAKRKQGPVRAPSLVPRPLALLTYLETGFPCFRTRPYHWVQLPSTSSQPPMELPAITNSLQSSFSLKSHVAQIATLQSGQLPLYRVGGLKRFISENWHPRAATIVGIPGHKKYLAKNQKHT